MPGLLNYLGDKQYLHGDKVTYNDFSMFELLDFCDFLSEGRIYSDFPALQEYFNRVKQLPGLQEYYSDDN